MHIMVRLLRSLKNHCHQSEPLNALLFKNIVAVKIYIYSSCYLDLSIISINELFIKFINEGK